MKLKKGHIIFLLLIVFFAMNFYCATHYAKKCNLSKTNTIHKTVVLYDTLINLQSDYYSTKHIKFRANEKLKVMSVDSIEFMNKVRYIVKMVKYK